MKAPFLLVALAGCAHVVRAQQVSSPAFVGCYSKTGSLQKKSSNAHQSSGVCHTTCSKLVVDGITGYSVMGMTKSTDCYCSQTFPNSEFKVDNSKCDQDCPGYGKETCTFVVISLSIPLTDILV
jgi:cell wall integrity and stress response component